MKRLDFAGLSHFWEKAKVWIGDAISKATTTLKQGLKLQDISDVTATAAEVNQLAGMTEKVKDAIDAKAPKASPELTGVPTAPTASTGSDNTQIANTAYVKQEIDAAKAAIKSELGSVYTPKGSVDTFDKLPKEGMKAGDVYNVKAAFEIDGEKYPKGTNVAYTDDGKWDALGGEVDLSGFLTEEDIEAITDSEIDELFTEE